MEQFKSIETTELVKIANAIRSKKGSTDKISLEDMPAMIREIEGGVELPELSNEGTASDLLSGKELIDSNGNVITGTIPNNGAISSTMDGLNIKQVTIPAGYTSGGTVSLDNTIDNEVDIQADLLAQAVAALEGKAGGGSEPSLQSKSVTPSAVQQTVVPDSGYDGLSKVTVNAMPTATQATPSISVNSSGLITASATQTAGYVAAGTKSATKQLTTQAAKTITPSTSSQTAVAAGRYTTGAVTVAAIPSTYVKPTTTKTATTYTPTTSNQTIAAGTYCSGAQTIKGDANLVAGNIKSGVSIFDVVGSYEGSGGGGTGGGGSVETLNVRLSNTSIMMASSKMSIGCTVINEDGSVTATHNFVSNVGMGITVEGVPIGSLVSIVTKDPMAGIDIRGEASVLYTSDDKRTFLVQVISQHEDTGKLVLAPFDI